MFINVLIFLADLLLEMLYGLFSFVNVFIPPQIPYYINLGLQYTRDFDGLFPMSDVYSALLFLLTILIGKYIIKIILMLYNALPIIGRAVNLPGTMERVTETTGASSTNKQGVRTWHISSTSKQRKRKS